MKTGILTSHVLAPHGDRGEGSGDVTLCNGNVTQARTKGLCSWGASTRFNVTTMVNDIIHLIHSIKETK